MNNNKCKNFKLRSKNYKRYCYCALLKKEGVDVIPHVFKNDNHSESAWQKELPVWMKECHIVK